uniref:Prepronociceptin n=1 Tax=Taeniopygia guttata TaxID=59729 RepID=A0A674GFJ3_TAEGU
IGVSIGSTIVLSIWLSIGSTIGLSSELSIGLTIGSTIGLSIVSPIALSIGLSIICLLECEGRAVPRATWELCAASSRPAPRPRRIPTPVWPPGDTSPSTHTSEDDLHADEDISRRPSAPPSSKEVQKRYGGFIGVRKSARKWNNQKRFSQFLRQYLGMAPRSSEYGGRHGDADDI